MTNIDGTMHRAVWENMCNRLANHRHAGGEPALTDREWGVVGRVRDVNMNLLRKTLAAELHRAFKRIFPEDRSVGL